MPPRSPRAQGHLPRAAAPPRAPCSQAVLPPPLPLRTGNSKRDARACVTASCRREQAGEDAGGSWRHEDDAVELAGLEQAQGLRRQFARRQGPVEHRLAHREALASPAPLSGRRPASRRQDARAGPGRVRILPTINLASASPVPGPAVTSAKPSPRAARAVASPTASSGRLKRLGKLRDAWQARASALRLVTSKACAPSSVQRHVGDGLDDQQRREHRRRGRAPQACPPGGWRRVQAA